MKWFKPGDIVIAAQDYPVLHPNKNRNVQKGDRITVSCTQCFKTENPLLYYWGIGYEAWDGFTYWIPFKNLELAPKGDMEDCLRFLQKHNRKPKIIISKKWAWGCLTQRGTYNGPELKRSDFLPHYIYRHLPHISDKVENDVVGGLIFRYADTEEQAYKNACEAWLLMTPAQQSFLSSLNYLDEIYD